MSLITVAINDREMMGNSDFLVTLMATSSFTEGAQVERDISIKLHNRWEHRT